MNRRVLARFGIIGIAVILIASVVATSGCLPKTTTTTTPAPKTPLQLLQEQVAAQAGTIASQQSTIVTHEGKLNQLSTQISGINIGTLQTDLNTVKSQLASLQQTVGTINSIQTQLKTLSDQVTAIQTKVDLLTGGTTSGEPVDPGDAMTITARYASSYTIETIPPGGTVTVSIPVHFTLKNELAVPITDVYLSASVRVTPDENIGLVTNSMSLIGELEWYPSGSGYFDSDTFNLKANQKGSWTDYLSFKIKNTSAEMQTDKTVRVSVKAYPEDYSLE